MAGVHSEQGEPEPVYSPDYISAVVDDILDSVWLAAAPHLSGKTLDAIKAEVNDYIDNYYDEAWER